MAARKGHREGLAHQAIPGYATGVDATNRATADALPKVGSAAVVVLVEGISDQIAVETAARCLGRDLEAERVVVVPIGGAHAIRGFLPKLPPAVRKAGLVDRREEEIFRRALTGPGGDRADLERLGFFVCDADLEDELLRAVGTAGVEALFDEQDELASFRRMQTQPAWRGRDLLAQQRRFLSSGSRRKSLYARLLVEAAIARDALPPPLAALLSAV